MKILYTKHVPYPPADVLSAYFDLEHVACVHPTTFGKARVLGTEPNALVWELESPRYLGMAFRMVIKQEYLSPDRIRARVTGGLFRGTEVLTRLHPSATGTFIEETYAVPLPECYPQRPVAPNKFILTPLIFYPDTFDLLAHFLTAAAQIVRCRFRHSSGCGCGLRRGL